MSIDTSTTFETLLKGISGNFTGRGIQLVFMLLTSLILAQQLGPAGLGIYALTAAGIRIVAVPIIDGIAIMCEREVAGSIAANTRGNLINAVLFSVYSSMAAMGIGCAALYLFIRLGPASSVDAGSYIIEISIVIFLLESLNSLFQAYIRGQGRTAEVMIPNSMIPGVSVLLLVFWSISEHELSVQIALGMRVVSLIIILPLWIWMVFRRNLELTDRDARRLPFRKWSSDMFQYSLVGAIYIVQFELGIVMLGFISAAEEVGIFRVATRVYLLASFSHLVCQAVAGPRIAFYWQSGNSKSIERLSENFSAIAISISILTVLLYLVVGEYVLRSFFGVAFVASFFPGLIFCLSGVFAAIGVLFDRILKMSSNQFWLILGMGAGLCFAFALNIVTIPTWGASAGAFGFMCSMIISQFVSYFVIRQKMDLHPLLKMRSFYFLAGRVK